VGVTLAFLTAVSIGASLSGSVGWPLAAGTVLGVPWILVGYDARTEAPLGLRFVAFGTAVALGLVALAARAELGVPAGAMSARLFLQGVYTVVADQGTLLASLTNGSALPPLPLLNFFDPAFATLVGAALLGLCVASVRPQSSTGVLLPLSIPLHRDGGERTPLPVGYGFTARQRALFGERTVADPPLTAWPPGLPAVVCGAAGAGAFLVAAYLDPYGVLLLLVITVAVASVLAVVLTEFPALLHWPKRSRRRSRSLLVRAPTPRVTKELLTSPSLPPPEEPAGPSSPGS
jgi:hypothetical protein